MELAHINERSHNQPRSKQEIAQDIYDGISASIHHLMSVEGLEKGHSRVVELRKERKIARRALLAFEEPQELIQAA